MYSRNPNICYTDAQELKRLLSIFSLVVVFQVTGCTDEPDPNAIALVGDTEVTETAFQAYLKRKRIPTDSPNQTDQAREVFLNRNALAAAIAKERLLDMAAIEADLHELRNELLIRRYFDTWLKENVSQEAVKQQYEADRTRYARRKVHVAHILLRTNAAMSDAQKVAKLAKARSIHAKLTGGASFVDLARQFSEDATTVNKGGELRWLQEGVGDPTFFQTALGLKKGEISEPISAQLGYHIIKALDDPVKEQLPFQQARTIIGNKLRHEAKQAEVKRLLSNVEIKKLK